MDIKGIAALVGKAVAIATGVEPIFTTIGEVAAAAAKIHNDLSVLPPGLTLEQAQAHKDAASATSQSQDDQIRKNAAQNLADDEK